MALNLQGYDALKKVDAAKAETANEDNRGVGGDESVSELLSRDIFSDYRSRSVSRGCTHPGAIAEAASLRYFKSPCRQTVLHACASDRRLDMNTWRMQALSMSAVPSPSLRAATLSGTACQRRQ